jgi:hypothetical protein
VKRKVLVALLAALMWAVTMAVGSPGGAFASELIDEEEKTAEEAAKAAEEEEKAAEEEAKEAEDAGDNI